jgi:hypothetical protein
MLHLFARYIRLMAGRLFMLYTQTLVADQAGERGIPYRYAVFLGQQFMHTLYVAITVMVKLF